MEVSACVWEADREVVEVAVEAALVVVVEVDVAIAVVVDENP